MKYLLDTSALLALHRREAEVETLLALFDDPANEMLLAAPSVAEFGRKLRELGEPADSVSQTLDQYRLLFAHIVAIDESVARVSLVDALIAAAARTQGATLVHRDGHFTAIPPDALGQVFLGAR